MEKALSELEKAFVFYCFTGNLSFLGKRFPDLPKTRLRQKDLGTPSQTMQAFKKA